MDDSESKSNPASPPSPRTEPLSYGQPPPRNRRWIVKAAVFLVLCLVATPAIKAVVGYFSMRQPSVNALKACAAFTAPAGTLVYGEGPDISTRMGLLAGYELWYQTPRTDRGSITHLHQTATPLRQLQQAGGVGFDLGPTLFLHERTSRAGKQRVVSVILTSAVFRAGSAPVSRISMDLAVTTIEPMGLFGHVRPQRNTVSISLGSWPSHAVPTFFTAGQPDANDASRFSIGYAFGDDAGVIEGVLNDDLTVTLTPRTGPLASPQPKGTP